MIIEALKMFFLVVVQNASFTWVSRARNSGSLKHHAIAAVFSNGIWLLVIRQVVLNFDNTLLMLTYLVAAVTGSLLMHWFSMKYLEKGKPGLIGLWKDIKNIWKIIKKDWES